MSVVRTPDQLEIDLMNFETLQNHYKFSLGKYKSFEDFEDDAIWPTLIDGAGEVTYEKVHETNKNRESYWRTTCIAIIF